MTTVLAPIDPQVMSYREMRRMLGYLGIGLPFVLVVGNAMIQGGPLEGSLSAYYHTEVRNVFVGSLCAIAVFLIAYHGYTLNEQRITNAAGAAAFGVAFLPTRAQDATGTAQQWIGYLHLVCAAVLFVLLAVMSFEFAKFKSSLQVDCRERRVRNKIYKSCGWVILACIGVCVVLGPIKAAARYHPMLWAESLAILAFGVSWLVKGLPLGHESAPANVREGLPSQSGAPGATGPATQS